MDEDHEGFDYAEALATLLEMVGDRVRVRVTLRTPAGIQTMSVGTLRWSKPVGGGEYPDQDELRFFAFAEQYPRGDTGFSFPSRGFRLGTSYRGEHPGDRALHAEWETGERISISLEDLDG